MALTLREWLKQKLDNMVSIQTTRIKHDGADLVAYAWSGKQLRIHLLTGETRTRTLRGLLQQATEVGVNTLFLVAGQLFPPNGQHMTAPGDWIQAIHSLNNERIYTFQIKNGTVEIRPIHLEEIPGSNDRKVWVGPLVEFDHLRFYRANLSKPRGLRGRWLVADFGSHAYWRNADYRHFQSRYEERNRANRQTYSETWSTGKTWQSSNDSRRIPTRSPMQSRLDACYVLLGVEQTADQDEVKRAFRKMAIAVHPDTSELPTDDAVEQFRRLNEAYDFIRLAKGWN